MFVCNNQIMCYDEGCGGRFPHEKCSECGNCGVFPEAYCVEEKDFEKESIKFLVDSGMNMCHAQKHVDKFLKRKGIK